MASLELKQSSYKGNCKLSSLKEVSCCANGTRVSPWSYNTFLLSSEKSSLRIPSLVQTSTPRHLVLNGNASMDHFRLTVAKLPPLQQITKRVLVSDIAKTFDVLGWFSPTIIKVKILLQQLWELKVDWDEPLPPTIHDAWLQWRSELKSLSDKHLPRCYSPKGAHVIAVELHGFCDASEHAYAGVVYLRMMDSDGNVHLSLVTSKTKVAPIKLLTIPRLELCGAHLLTQLLHHVKQVFNLPLSCVHAWTDSTIVLCWLVGNPRRFKTYVGNRVSRIMELIAPDRWNHVNGTENPADCASRGLFPSELSGHELWWNGPRWLKLSSTGWPQQSIIPQVEPSDEEREVCFHVTAHSRTPLIAMDRYSNFTQLKYVTAWILRFIHNCRLHGTQRVARMQLSLSTQELLKAEAYWLLFSQEEHFVKEIRMLKTDRVLPTSSPLLSLRPILDSAGVLRVGGREQNSRFCYSAQHPAILHGKHPVTKLVIHSEHLRLLHAGPTLLTASLCRRYHIIGFRKAVRSVTRRCVICRRISVRPQPQNVGPTAH